MVYEQHRAGFLNSDLIIWADVSNTEQEYINVYLVIKYNMLGIHCSCRKNFYYGMDDLEITWKRKMFLNKHSVYLEYAFLFSK